MSKPMSLAAREELFQRWATANPNPTTELHFRNPFELLIAVMLSAQTTDVRVNMVTPALFAAAPTAAAMVALGEDRIRQLIQIIGLFRNKAKHVWQACCLLVERHGGEVPRERASLEALPGVGRKTANVVLNTAFGEPTMAVDTHIFRVSNRMGLAMGRDVLAVEQALLKRVPPAYLLNAHHWLILHGRYVCKARNPQCSSCSVADLCRYAEKAV